MADIATLAGVAKQTLYSHFTDKEALFRAVVARVREDRMPTGTTNQAATIQTSTIPTATGSTATSQTVGGQGADNPVTDGPGVGGNGTGQGMLPDLDAPATPAPLANPDPITAPDLLAAPVLLAGPDLLTALAGLGTYLVTLITDPELAALRRITLTDPHWTDLWSLDGPAPLRAALAQELAAQSELDIPDPTLAADQFMALVTHRAVLDSLSQTTRPVEDYRTVDACVTFLRAFRKPSATSANSEPPSEV
jgi:AcrR family transcriptional regulator